MSRQCNVSSSLDNYVYYLQQLKRFKVVYKQTWYIACYIFYDYERTTSFTVTLPTKQVMIMSCFKTASSIS